MPVPEPPGLARIVRPERLAPEARSTRERWIVGCHGVVAIERLGARLVVGCLDVQVGAPEARRQCSGVAPQRRLQLVDARQLVGRGVAGGFARSSQSGDGRGVRALGGRLDDGFGLAHFRRVIHGAQGSAPAALDGDQVVAVLVSRAQLGAHDGDAIGGRQQTELVDSTGHLVCLLLARAHGFNSPRNHHRDHAPSRTDVRLA